MIFGVLLPFWGTALGAACVFALRGALRGTVQRALTGFAAGIMVAASVWSLLIPALEQSAPRKWSFVPAALGLAAGVLFMVLLDWAEPKLSKNRGQLDSTAMLVLAVTIHNIPEGMAVGAVYAGLMAGGGMVTAAGAMALSAGIAIQNFPEGAIISLPLRAQGMGRGKAFLYGVLSGAVEPLAAVLTIWAAGLIVPVLPWLLSFAAGAMLYVVAAELIPEATADGHIQPGTLLFAAGFTLMMALDVALG